MTISGIPFFRRVSVVHYILKEEEKFIRISRQEQEKKTCTKVRGIKAIKSHTINTYNISAQTRVQKTRIQGVFKKKKVIL